MAQLQIGMGAGCTFERADMAEPGRLGGGAAGGCDDEVWRPRVARAHDSAATSMAARHDLSMCLPSRCAAAGRMARAARAAQTGGSGNKRPRKAGACAGAARG